MAAFQVIPVKEFSHQLVPMLSFAEKNPKSFASAKNFLAFSQ